MCKTLLGLYSGVELLGLKDMQVFNWKYVKLFSNIIVLINAPASDVGYHVMLLWPTFFTVFGMSSVILPSIQLLDSPIGICTSAVVF